MPQSLSTLTLSSGSRISWWSQSSRPGASSSLPSTPSPPSTPGRRSVDITEQDPNASASIFSQSKEDNLRNVSMAVNPPEHNIADASSSHCGHEDVRMTVCTETCTSPSEGKNYSDLSTLPNVDEPSDDPTAVKVVNLSATPVLPSNEGVCEVSINRRPLPLEPNACIQDITSVEDNMCETQVAVLDSRGEPDSAYANTSHSSPKVSQSNVGCNHDDGVHNVVGDEPDKYFECAVGPTLQDEDDTALGNVHQRPDLIIPVRLPQLLLGRGPVRNSSDSEDLEKGNLSPVSDTKRELQSISRYRQFVDDSRTYLDRHYHLTREPDVVLPTAPTDKEKYGFIQTYRPLFCAAGIFAFLCTSAGLWLFTLSAPQFYWFGVIATLLQVHVCLYHLMGLFSTNFDFEGHKSILERQPIREDNAPTVDILLPCCKEPLIILENTYKHIKQLKYPASRIKVYVLDDGGIASVKDLAFRYGFNYLCRDNRPYLKKAGNLRWAFTRTQGEFFVIYDADFCPRRDFLLEIIPRMMDDRKVAITQTPQFFQERIEHTWIERGASQVQEMFYRWCQVNRNKWGASICVGSNAVYRREALAETGGTAEVGASEDVYTGFFAVSRGWTLSYVPLCLAAGISPDKPRAFFSQQVRWCQGSTSLFLSSIFWRAKMTNAQRLCYLSGMLYYWSAAIGVFVVPLPGVFMIWIRPHLLKYYNLAFAIPSIVYGLLVFRLWSRSTHSLAVQHIKIMQSYAYVSGLLGLTFGNITDWVPSGDSKAHGSNSYRNMRVLAICWTFAYQTAFITGCVYCVVSDLVVWYQLLPLLLLDTFNLYLAIPFFLAS